VTETATILFTDVEGSTNLRTRLGDADANRVLAESERQVVQAVTAHGGEVVKQLGDGVMACFDSARAAVMAAMEVQRPDADGVRVRVGVHAGEISRANGDLQGAAVHAAARIMGSAAGGEVLISERARELAGLLPEGTRVTDRGLFWLKGFPDRWRLFEVIGEGSNPAVTTQPGSRYVGRDDELADLRRAAEQADAGHGSVVLIGGEPGVGKTRLAEEAAALARRRGMLVFTGRCSDTEGAPPYLPFVEVLEAVARFVPEDALRAALGDTAGDVARVMPELRRMFPDLPPPVELPPEQERRYLLNAVRDVLARAARWHALVLILDDLHWADEPSLLLLEHLAEVLPETPCLIIGTYRDVELEVGRPLARTLESLLRKRLAERVSLRRLSEEGVRELITGLAEQDPPDSLVRVVFSETEGNPFFVEEVFRHLAEEGRLFDDAGRFRGDLSISEVDVPEGVRLVIGRRLERLSEATLEVLAAGAVLGRIFAFATMSAIAERPADELLDALDEAERSKLLAPAGGGSGSEERYAFSHELVRQTLLAGLTSSRRRRLHLRAADAIQTVYGDAAGEQAGDVAHHLLEAGAAADAARTVSWLRTAGDRALAAAAFEDAARNFDAALSFESVLDARATAELQFVLGQAQRGAVRWEEALATWKQSLAGFEALGDDDRLAEVAWHVGYQLLWAGRRDELAELLGLVLTRLEGTDSGSHARLLLGAAAGFTSVGQLGPAQFMLSKAERMVETIGDEAAARDLEQAKAFVHWTFPGVPESIEHGLRAVELMRDAGVLWDLANVESFAASSLALAGREEEGRAYADRAAELADRIGHVGAHIYVNRGYASLEIQRSGTIEDYVELMRGETVIAREAGIAWAEANAEWHIAMAMLWLGRWDEAVQGAAASLSFDTPQAYAGWGHGIRVLIRATAGTPEETRALIESYRDAFPAPGETASTGMWMQALCSMEALAQIGDWDALAELAPVLERIGVTGIARRIIDSRSVEAMRGLMATALGDAAAAGSAFESAVALADQKGFRIEAAEVRRLWAMSLDRLGGRVDEAAALRAAAAERYRALGMERHAAMCEPG
jgi:class 3 adenylate cyclase/tetratricopeptide (TPR) repeat protein